MPINFFCAGMGFMGMVIWAANGQWYGATVCLIICLFNLALAGSYQRDSD